MNSLAALNFPAGKVGFSRTVRGWDEQPRLAFMVELPGRPTMYGEWRANFEDDGNDFNIEIVGFGYLRESHLGSAYPLHRKTFSGLERDALEHLIRALFADEGARAGEAPFATPKTRFLGGVNFAPSWIQASDKRW